MASSENKKEYIDRLRKYPEKGEVIVVRVTNRRSTPMGFQIGPSGDVAPPMKPGVAYEIVAQGPGTGPFTEEGYILNLEVYDGEVRVWVEVGDNGQAFHDGVSVAY